MTVAKRRAQVQPRCAQCGLSISPKRLEQVETPQGFVWLHKGGCTPREEAQQ